MNMKNIGKLDKFAKVLLVALVLAVVTQTYEMTDCAAVNPSMRIIDLKRKLCW